MKKKLKEKITQNFIIKRICSKNISEKEFYVLKLWLFILVCLSFILLLTSCFLCKIHGKYPVLLWFIYGKPTLNTDDLFTQCRTGEADELWKNQRTGVWLTTQQDRWFCVIITKTVSDDKNMLDAKRLIFRCSEHLVTNFCIVHSVFCGIMIY
jgi:hypothetical protein